MESEHEQRAVEANRAWLQQQAETDSLAQLA
jgi:hypothetical protein